MTNKKQSGVPSPETQTEAMKIARASQKQGQTKEQTKLIAQGIQHGIDLYKKQQKAKSRERDKLRKKQTKQQSDQRCEPIADSSTAAPVSQSRQAWLPWLLLAVSWIGFITYSQF
ncbi:DUF2956 domain-containing protein [Photobacterium nomapromontoriensis]|uniref:DUF2956 domain-containing protein n=1 Tax=Photobacterium nomapromontoriensis TaxID=2910237 RepID=UPI003D0FC47C